MWMQSLARSSTVLRYQEIKFIPNTLGDFQISQNMSVDKSEYLEVGIASVNSGIFLKGGDIVQQLEDRIQKLNLKIKINYLSEYSRAHKENAFWNKLDVLLVPSRAENSPNVIHEAKSIGLPIIATDVGGINELINPVIDKLVSIQNLNVDYLVDLLIIFNKIQSKKVKNEIMNMYRKYTKNALVDHIKLYKEMF
jgi:glycosyltransferase involved in cell wall biosynthesis